MECVTKDHFTSQKAETQLSLEDRVLQLLADFEGLTASYQFWALSPIWAIYHARLNGRPCKTPGHSLPGQAQLLLIDQEGIWSARVRKSHRSWSGNVFEILRMRCLVDPIHHFKIVIAVTDAPTWAATSTHWGPRWRMGYSNAFLWHYSPNDWHLHCLLWLYYIAQE